jgi:hypothetical protein
MKQKIYCQLSEEELDNTPIKELQKMVGWVEFDPEKKVWDVTTRDGGGFECKTQEMAHIMANTEMLIAMQFI